MWVQRPLGQLLRGSWYPARLKAVLIWGQLVWNPHMETRKAMEYQAVYNPGRQKPTKYKVSLQWGQDNFSLSNEKENKLLWPGQAKVVLVKGAWKVSSYCCTCSVPSFLGACHLFMSFSTHERKNISNRFFFSMKVIFDYYKISKRRHFMYRYLLLFSS